MLILCIWEKQMFLNNFRLHIVRSKCPVSPDLHRWTIKWWLSTYTITVLGNRWGLLPVSQVLIHLQWLLSLPKKQDLCTDYCSWRYHLALEQFIWKCDWTKLRPTHQHTVKSVCWHQTAAKKDNKNRKQEHAACAPKTQTRGRPSG